MTISPAYPDLLQNGTPADATQVMADFYQIQNDVNANAAHNGDNSDITSLTGLTTPLSVTQGGTGASTAIAALTNLGAASAASVAALPVVIPGSVLLWPANAAPTGYLECDGSAVSRATYAAIFTVMGIAYGAGDGSTTFNLPDMRGYFARGWDHGAGVDPARTFGSTQQDQFQTHAHNVSDPSHSHALSGISSNAKYLDSSTGGPNDYTGTGAHSTGVIPQNTNTSATGVTVGAPSTGNTGTETRPKNLTFMYIVKI